MRGKLDLKRDEKQFYSAPTDRFVEVDVPRMSFLQIDGAGSPESDAYARAVEALYALSYPVKFASKNRSAGTTWCARSRASGGRTGWSRSPTAPRTSGRGR